MSRRSVITRQTLIPLGLVLMIGRPTASLIWHGAAAFQEMRDMRPKFEHVEHQLDEQGKTLVQMQLSQAAVLQALTDLKRPVIHTSHDVKDIKEQVAALSTQPLIPLYMGPLTKR